MIIYIENTIAKALGVNDIITKIMGMSQPSLAPLN